MKPLRAPMVGADLWTAVMTAGGWRCECVGACGRLHWVEGPRVQERCRDARTDRLVAVPVNFAASFVEAATARADELQALCLDCVERATAKVRAGRVAARAAEAAAAQPTLFEEWSA